MIVADPASFTVDVDSAPFFAGLAAGRLVLQRCTTCRRFQFPPRCFCATCGGREVKWEPASGRGKVHAVTVCYRAATEALRSQEPFAVALVELEEGVRVLARIVNTDPDAVTIGRAVRATVIEAGERRPMLAFECAEEERR